MKRIYSKFAVPLLLATISYFSTVSGQNDCVIPLSSQPDRNLPLIFLRGWGPLFPVNSRSIVVHHGEIVDIVCAGQNNKLVGLLQPYVTATCHLGRLLVPPNFVLRCTQTISEVVTDTGQSCGSLGNSKLLKIGWDWPNQGNWGLILVCFNQGILTTEFSQHIIMGAGMTYKDMTSQYRPHFKLDNYFSHLSPSISTVYTNQNQAVAALLGSTTLANAYIRGWSSQSYLARGHLAPDADFSLITWQDATYHLINAVPQWHAFNNGNWKDLEAYIRTVASKPTPRDLTIYTGTHGILKLPDVNNNSVGITLFHGTNKQGVPVPEFIWKAVYDVQRLEAVAFVMINHPNNLQYPIPAPQQLCPDVCANITWLKWNNRFDKNKGVIYCCTVDSLAVNIPNVPTKPNLTLMV